MAKHGDDRYKINIIWLLAFVSSLGAITAMILSYTGHFTGLPGLFSDLLIFIATVLVSYLITNNNERSRFEKEMQRLANFSRRRVELTTDNIQALSNELPQIDEIHEMHRLVAFTLRNLAADSGASLKEIEEMGYVDGNEAGEMSRPDIPITRRSPNTENDVPVSTDMDTNVDFNCTNCGITNSTSLKQFPGTTKVVDCKNCGMNLNVHRLGDGSTKVVNRWSSRSSGVGRSTSEGNTLRAPHTPSDQVVTPNPVEANCPRCGHNISFPGKSNRIVDDRFCEGCQANVIHNQKTDEVYLGKPYQEKFLDQMPQELFKCECGKVFPPSFLETDEGEKYFACFSCHTLYRYKAATKVSVNRECVTDGCGTHLVFKVDPKSRTGKQICYNCKHRLKYDQEKDEVLEVEDLEVPVVQRDEWMAGGNLCPKCGKPAGQGTVTNDFGEKFHMHWNCKYPFQIVD